MFDRLPLQQNQYSNHYTHCVNCSTILFPQTYVKQFISYDQSNLGKLSDDFSDVNKYKRFDKRIENLDFLVLKSQLASLSTFKIDYTKNGFMQCHPFLFMYAFEILCQKCGFSLGFKIQTVNQNTKWLQNTIIINTQRCSLLIKKKQHRKQFILSLKNKLKQKIQRQGINRQIDISSNFNRNQTAYKSKIYKRKQEKNNEINHGQFNENKIQISHSSNSKNLDENNIIKTNNKIQEECNINHQYKQIQKIITKQKLTKIYHYDQDEQKQYKNLLQQFQNKQNYYNSLDYNQNTYPINSHFHSYPTQFISKTQRTKQCTNNSPFKYQDNTTNINSFIIDRPTQSKPNWLSVQSYLKLLSQKDDIDTKRNNYQNNTGNIISQYQNTYPIINDYKSNNQQSKHSKSQSIHQNDDKDSFELQLQQFRYDIQQQVKLKYMPEIPLYTYQQKWYNQSILQSKQQNNKITQNFEQKIKQSLQQEQYQVITFSMNKNRDQLTNTLNQYKLKIIDFAKTQLWQSQQSIQICQSIFKLLQKYKFLFDMIQRRYYTSQYQIKYFRMALRQSIEKWMKYGKRKNKFYNRRRARNYRRNR